MSELHPKQDAEPIDSFEDVIETNVPFSEERPSRTMGRAEWLATRSGAELLLYMSKLGIATEQKVKLMTFFGMATDEWLEFVGDGLNLDRYNYATGDCHPLECELRKNVEGIVEKWDDENCGEDNIFGPSSEAMEASDTLGMLEGLEIVGMVQGLGPESLVAELHTDERS